MATEEATDRQRRVVIAAKEDVLKFLEAAANLQAHSATYARLGLASDEVLDDDAFSGTGVVKAEYRAAITSIDALATWFTGGHGTNFETLAR